MNIFPPQKTSLILWAVAGLFACAPLFVNAYWMEVFNTIGLYALLALSLNIILGHTGLFHMGHAAFYALGAYTTAILNTVYQIPVLWTLPAAGLVAGAFALIVARPIIHLRGDYLLIVTIGIVEIVRIALVNDVFGVTGGSNGIFGISRPTIFGWKIVKQQHFFYLIWGFTLGTIFLFRRLENSRFGRALRFIKEDETAAEGTGINAAWYKLAAFGIGAFWAGMTGTIYAAKMTIIEPGSFSFTESVMLFCMVILGGAGSIPGVLLGAILITGLPEVFRIMDLAEYRMLVFGVAMMAMMIFRSQGILPPRPEKYAVQLQEGQ